jgi:hypothetical protein
MLFLGLVYIKCVQKVAVHLGYGTQIWLNGFRPVSSLVDITSKTFYKCTATFRTHCKKKRNTVYMCYNNVETSVKNPLRKVWVLFKVVSL